MADTQHQSQSEHCIKLRAPNKYNVIMLNDDQTPMDFVIQVLIEIFNKDPETAQSITMEIHNKGRGVAGTYSYEVAEQKSTETTTAAKANGFPLNVTLEEQ